MIIPAGVVVVDDWQKVLFFFLTFRGNCKSDNALLETHTLPLRLLEEHVQMEKRKKVFQVQELHFYNCSRAPFCFSYVIFSVLPDQ